MSNFSEKAASVTNPSRLHFFEIFFCNRGGVSTVTKFWVHWSSAETGVRPKLQFGRNWSSTETGLQPMEFGRWSSAYGVTLLELGLNWSSACLLEFGLNWSLVSLLHLGLNWSSPAGFRLLELIFFSFISKF